MPRRWHQAGGSISVGDGGNKARSPGRARRKPLKPLRGECRVSRCDRGDYARMLFYFCMRGCGRIERLAFPAPSDVLEAQIERQNSRACGEFAEVWVRDFHRRHCERSEAIHLRSCGAEPWIASLALAMTA